MTILEELKKMIKARGGTTTDIHTIAAAVHVLADLEDSEGGEG